MPRIIIAFSFISILLGCATTSHKDTRIDKSLTPPIPNFLNKWKGASIQELETLRVGEKERSIRWWKIYTYSVLNKDKSPDVACLGFKTLSAEKDFPLADLALLRAYESCTDKKSLAELPSIVTPWYREIYVDIKLKGALNSDVLTDDLEALIDKARLESNRKNKEDYYMKALLVAQKIGNPEEVQSVQALLYKNSPRLNPLPELTELSAVASDHRFHREFDKALAVYQKIITSKKSSIDDLFQAYKNIRQTYKVAQRRTEYINATANLVNWSKKEFQRNKRDRRAMARYHDSQVLFAKTLWTEDQTSRAVQVLNETHRLLRGLYPMDEVYFIRGRIDEEKGNFPKALEYFEASYTQDVSLEGLRDKISWLKSWNYYKLQQWAEAKASLEQMKNLVQDPSDKARACFWLAKTLKNLNQEAEAKEELHRLMSEDPLGYYGMLAIRELKQDFAPLKNDSKELEGLSLLGISDMDAITRLTIEWLIAVNEKSYAEKALSAAVEELKKRSITNEDTWLTISSVYARTGLYLPLFAAIGSLEAKVKDRLLNDHPDLLFPRPFGEIISAASDHSGVEKEFIYSIIRQESAFNPEARSPADAFGLMQLLPSIGKQLAKENHLQYQNPSDLFLPHINIPLGAFELKTLMKKYDNQFILAVSGYNANDSAIRGWLKTRYRPDSVEFIEEVPYEETRTYIKLVMRNYVFYRRLLNHKKPVSFPESLLSLRK